MMTGSLPAPSIAEPASNIGSFALEATEGLPILKVATKTHTVMIANTFIVFIFPLSTSAISRWPYETIRFWERSQTRYKKTRFPDYAGNAIETALGMWLDEELLCHLSQLCKRDRLTRGTTRKVSIQRGDKRFTQWLLESLAPIYRDARADPAPLRPLTAFARVYHDLIHMSSFESRISRTWKKAGASADL
jgi:hypothetical protein